MDNLKDIRWKQRFENFEKSYKLLKKYSDGPIKSELITDIVDAYIPEIDKLYNKLSKEL